MPASRMHPRAPSLRRLRTAFRTPSPASSTRSTATSDASLSSFSPRRLFSVNSFGNKRSLSPSSIPSSSGTLSSSGSDCRPRRPVLLSLGIRRQPSLIDVEMEEERRAFPAELEMLEPRPEGVVVGGIFEVLSGRF